MHSTPSLYHIIYNYCFWFFYWFTFRWVTCVKYCLYQNDIRLLQPLLCIFWLQKNKLSFYLCAGTFFVFFGSQSVNFFIKYKKIFNVFGLKWPTEQADCLSPSSPSWMDLGMTVYHWLSNKTWRVKCGITDELSMAKWHFFSLISPLKAISQTWRVSSNRQSKYTM